MAENKNEFMNAPDSYWITSTGEGNYPSLEQDIEVDIAIVGGGMAGISSAYLLGREGYKVAIIEADRILRGTTGHTTAKITAQHSLVYARIVKEMGREMARQYAEANQTAIQTMADIIEANHIDCDFERRPAYIYTQSNKYLKDIEDEAKAASALGIKASCLDDAPLPFDVKAALRFDDQAQFHPLKYLKALAPEIVKQGGRIFEHTQAVNIKEGEPCSLVCSNGKKVTCDKVIIASHFPFFDGGGLYFSRIYAERSYVLGITIEEKFPPGMFINAEEPTRSLRSQKFENGELILVGGEHHKTGHCKNTNLHYSNLLDFAHKTFTVRDVPYRWSAQDCMTMDGLPYVGHLTSRSRDLYVATGFGKWGMTNSTAAAMILKDLITVGSNPWAEVYSPARFTRGASIRTLVSQNVNVAVQYVSGKLEPALSDADVAIGEAKLIKADGQKVGAYRDENEKLHVVDITCPHLGCELEWNNAEKSWDCPCHGSRFNYTGDIIEGPALNRLNGPAEGRNEVEPNVFQ